MQESFFALDTGEAGRKGGFSSWVRAMYVVRDHLRDDDDDDDVGVILLVGKK